MLTLLASFFATQIFGLLLLAVGLLAMYLGIKQKDTIEKQRK